MATMAIASLFPRSFISSQFPSRYCIMNAFFGVVAEVAPIRLKSCHNSSHIRSLRHSSIAKAARDEEVAAKVAANTIDKTSTIFDKIVKKEIPATIVYEDNKVLAFRDINPQAPVHVVLIPKDRDGLTQLSKSDPRHKDILGHLLYTVKVVAEQEGLADGYRVVINDGPNGCQSVYHLHLHILGGRQLKWPPG